MSEAKNEIVVYQPSETIRLDVRLENETVWLTQAAMAQLFGCGSDNIDKHLKNIYDEGELKESATTEIFSVVRFEGDRQGTRQISTIIWEPFCRWIRNGCYGETLAVYRSGV